MFHMQFLEERLPWTTMLHPSLRCLVCQAFGGMPHQTGKWPHLEWAQVNEV